MNDFEGHRRDIQNEFRRGDLQVKRETIRAIGGATWIGFCDARDHSVLKPKLEYGFIFWYIKTDRSPEIEPNSIDFRYFLNTGNSPWDTAKYLFLKKKDKRKKR